MVIIIQASIEGSISPSDMDTEDLPKSVMTLLRMLYRYAIWSIDIRCASLSGAYLPKKIGRGTDIHENDLNRVWVGISIVNNLVSLCDTESSFWRVKPCSYRVSNQLNGVEFIGDLFQRYINSEFTNL
ncbi:MAG: hypothetical protein ACQEXB_09565 [Bacillota bacterium]